MRFSPGSVGVAVVALMATSGVEMSAQYGQRGSYAAAVMSGTYDLETARGDSAERTADLATRDLPRVERDRVYDRLLARLEPPTTLAIDRAGRTVTISSSSGPRATFDADGRPRREIDPDGREIVTRAEFLGDVLSVSTTGNRDTDYTVTFEVQNGGNGLLVTRRFDSVDLVRPVTMRSFYRRVASEPRWDVYGPPPPPPPPPPAYVIPDGTRVIAVLDAPLSSRTLRGGEHFTMTVRSPLEYEGAVIDGVVARVTPYGPGRAADLRIDFSTIHLRGGRAVEFGAVLSTVRTPAGAVLRVDAPADPGRPDTTVQQTAVGAALGAIIGAIAGGGKGAAIGALVGGASGAILAQDRAEYVELPPGTEVTVVVRRYRAP